MVEREYNLLATIEELRANGLMQFENPLCLGGGHGVRAYLAKDLQRFSIDLDFYSSVENIHDVLRRVGKFGTFEQVGYGIESEDRFKRYDSAVPADLKRCTVALLKRYHQSFRSGDVDPEFYVTISNTLSSMKCEWRRPKSYIGIDYVEKEVPVLSPELLIAGKIRIIPHRKVKDLYKDIFDIYTLFNLSDSSVEESKIISTLSTARLGVRKTVLFSRFKETSDPSNARNAIKLPKESRLKYLGDWKIINSFVKQKVLTILQQARALEN